VLLEAACHPPPAPWLFHQSGRLFVEYPSLSLCKPTLHSRQSSDNGGEKAFHCRDAGLVAFDDGVKDWRSSRLLGGVLLLVMPVK
jgi:hypothetical protein